MPKLCFLSNAASPHTQKWAIELSRRGWTVELISFLPAEIPNIPVHVVPKGLGGKVDFILRLRWVERKIQAIQPDLLHAHYATSFGFIGALSRQRPFIISAWGSDIFSFPRKSFFHRALLSWILGKSDGLCSTSEIMAKEMYRYIDKDSKIDVIPFGVDLKQFSPPELKEASPRRQVVFGVAKYLQPIYGLDYLLKAFARVEYSHPGCALLKIAGNGPELGRLQSLARKLGISDKVDWLGDVANPEVAKFYQELDVVVVPSLEESFGVTAVEGSACARPIIASRVGGLPEVVLDGKTGIMIDSQNVESLVSSMVYMIEHPEDRLRMGLAGREFVQKNYNFQDNVTQMEKVYRALIESRVK